MGRAKRLRKQRAKSRRERRALRLEKLYQESFLSMKAQYERTKARKALEASDMPEALKTVFIAFVDPVGFVWREAEKAIRAHHEEKVPVSGIHEKVVCDATED